MATQVDTASADAPKRSSSSSKAVPKAKKANGKKAANAAEEKSAPDAPKPAKRAKTGKPAANGKAPATASNPAPTAKVQEKEAKSTAIAKAKAIAPELAAKIGSTPRTKYRGNPDIFGRLVEDHDQHRALLAMIESSAPKSAERPLLFAELAKELKSHAAAEEQALWSTVMRNPSTTDEARHAVAEHKEIDELLADLAARDMTSPGWLRRFAALKEEYLHHIGEEEQEQFVAAEKHLSESDTRYMRKVFNQRKKAEKAAAKIEKKLKLKD